MNLLEFYHTSNVHVRFMDVSLDQFKSDFFVVNLLRSLSSLIVCFLKCAYSSFKISINLKSNKTTHRFKQGYLSRISYSKIYRF